MFVASFIKHQLQFLKPAKTSRNTMQSHVVYYVKLIHKITQNTYWGEAAPLPGLSIDNISLIEQKLTDLCQQVTEGYNYEVLDFDGFPSVKFAFETAFLSSQHNQDFMVYDTPFYHGNQLIDINGLVWMNEPSTMLNEAISKAQAGFTTIKFKVGALDFDEECRLLEQFRKQFNAFKITIRLDANGAFKNDEAIEQLKTLARFEVDSIEQPIKAKQWDMMQEVCAKSPIPIALDEELIGVDVYTNGNQLLQHIKPQHIILKPTLLGGLKNSEHWVKLAHKNNIGWWATSALESNIGLNAIAQWTSTQQLQTPQGLGTGSLYANNINSPLLVNNGKLSYNTSLNWEVELGEG
ncbi:MAG: o-succinylbenzoate synthase [Bacteroidia bacterium]|nr:o-succinylbenzoate synthase [Bacteroidia bacterium]MBP9690133.1 o-succinylbenzoate synthase [Bacteroidia bacterium]